MEDRRHVVFIGVELSGGVELAAPVEKATAGPRAAEGRDGREARWRGRKMGCRALVQWRCRLAERRRDGEGGTVESAVAEAVHWSVLAALSRLYKYPTYVTQKNICSPPPLSLSPSRVFHSPTPLSLSPARAARQRPPRPLLAASLPHFFIHRPRFRPSSASGSAGLAVGAVRSNAAVFTALAAACVATYAIAVSRDPGHVPASFVPDVEDAGSPIHEIKRKGGDLRYCQKCSHYKPPRAHHCCVCKRCVLRMDLVELVLICSLETTTKMQSS
ncbi:uncharacterized protein [Miscanthus floridulus]|uniref:uncharacterized protein n=1 Tax=Miscanthus floridulus TaxID=154761 RepID=UPI003457AB37